MNLGQGWYTVLTLFGGTLETIGQAARNTESISCFHLLRPDMGRILHPNTYARLGFRPGRRHSDTLYRLRIHRHEGWRKLLAAIGV